MGKPRPGRRPITDADREEVRRLHAAGMSRNEIARKMRRSGHTVSKLAAELGLSFHRGDDPGLRAATEARKADARARRAALAIALLDDAERLRRQLWAPCTAYNFGGRDNTYNEQQLDEPDFRAKREIMTAVGIAIDRAVRLDEYDSGASLTAVVSLLDTIASGLTARYGTGDDEFPPAGDDQGAAATAAR